MGFEAAFVSIVAWQLILNFGALYAASSNYVDGYIRRLEDGIALSSGPDDIHGSVLLIHGRSRDAASAWMRQVAYESPKTLSRDSDMNQLVYMLVTFSRLSDEQLSDLVERSVFRRILHIQEVGGASQNVVLRLTSTSEQKRVFRAIMRIFWFGVGRWVSDFAIIVAIVILCASLFYPFAVSKEWVGGPFASYLADWSNIGALASYVVIYIWSSLTWWRGVAAMASVRRWLFRVVMFLMIYVVHAWIWFA